MTTVNITSPFTFTRDDGRPLDIAAGVQDLDDDVASHWFVQAHCASVPEEQVKPESPAPRKQQK